MSVLVQKIKTHFEILPGFVVHVGESRHGTFGNCRGLEIAMMFARLLFFRETKSY